MQKWQGIRQTAPGPVLNGAVKQHQEHLSSLGPVTTLSRCTRLACRQACSTRTSLTDVTGIPSRSLSMRSFFSATICPVCAAAQSSDLKLLCTATHTALGGTERTQHDAFANVKQSCHQQHRLYIIRWLLRTAEGQAQHADRLQPVQHVACASLDARLLGRS